MDLPRILVVTAVFPEARAIARAFQLTEVAGLMGGLRAWQGKELALVVVGIGASGFRQLSAVPNLEAFQILMMAGVAGALPPALQVGDVVVDGRDLHEPLPPFRKAFLGRLHTADVLIGDPRQKARIFESTGCLAVDMETEIALGLAKDHGLAFLAIRGISDAAEDAIDPALLTLVDGEGRPRLGRAMGMICRHPRKLRSMLRLGRATSRAMDGVVATLHELLASGWHMREANRRGGA